jgi:hypothetical protein
VPSTRIADMGVALESASRRAAFLADFGRMRRDEAATAEGERRRVLDLESATCLLEAAQWLMATEPAEALEPLGTAGRVYTDHGHSFGLFLRVLAGETGAVLPTQIRVHLGHLRPGADPLDAPAAMDHPQQHVYALLAAAGHADTATTEAAVVRDLARSSPHRHGAVTVGALGMPIRHFWALPPFVRGAAEDRDPVGSAGATRDRAAAVLAAFVRQHLLVCGSARTVPRLWEHAAADVHPVDLDTVALFTLICRHREPDELATSVRGLLPELGPSDVTIIDIARDFAEATLTARGG